MSFHDNYTKPLAIKGHAYSTCLYLSVTFKMDVCLAVLLEFNIIFVVYGYSYYINIMKFGKHNSFLHSELSVASNIDHHVELCTIPNTWICVHSLICTESR